jgi:hypothetical protein
MITRTVQFIAVICAAVAMASAWAHLLALPAKIGLSREAYLTVQQIYRGWALLGIVIVGALVASGVLAWLERDSGVPFHLALLSTILIALALVSFFAFTFPANQATQNWTVLPEDWARLRTRWEYSHAAGAILYFLALCALVLSAIWKRA